MKYVNIRHSDNNHLKIISTKPKNHNTTGLQYCNLNSGTQDLKKDKVLFSKYFEFGMSFTGCDRPPRPGELN